MGVLLIWCPASGRAFSTGIETDARSFASLPNSPARASALTVARFTFGGRTTLG